MGNDDRMLFDRVQTLERRNRFMMIVLLSGIALAGVALLTGQIAPNRVDVVRAERFILIDSTGRERAVLGFQESSRAPGCGAMPGFFIFDTTGKQRVALSAGESPDGRLSISSLNLVGKQNGFSMEASELGASCRLNSERGMLWLGDRTGRDVGLWVLDNEHRDRIVAALDSNFDPSIRLFRQYPARPAEASGATDSELTEAHSKWRKEKSAAESVQIDVRSDGQPSIQLRDRSGILRAVFGTASLRDERADSTIDTSVGSLVLFGADGRMVWRVPQ